jgi:Rieske Fe-S protein
MSVNSGRSRGNGSESGCNDCTLLQSRRSFLRDGALAAIIVSMGTLGVSARSVGAMSVGFVSGRRHDTNGRQTVSYPVPPNDGAQIDHDNEVILVRWENEVYAFNLSCPHQRTALRWDDADHRFQCPKHHSKYQPDGEFISGRATRNMDRFVIRRDSGNMIVVDVDAMLRSDQDLVAWTGAALKV